MGPSTSASTDIAIGSRQVFQWLNSSIWFDKMALIILTPLSEEASGVNLSTQECLHFAVAEYRVQRKEARGRARP